MIQHVPQHVVIVGGSAGRDSAKDYVSERSSIWCVARIYDKVPYADYVFEMHTSLASWSSSTYTAHTDNKLILRHATKRLPNATLLPVDELYAEFGHIFTSSFSWMTAYAILQKPQVISFVGVNMIHASEQGSQRDGMLFLLGYAKARGITLNMPQQSRLKQGVRI